MNPRHSVILLAAFVAGCAGDSAGDLFVAPGRFDHLTCDGLAGAATTARRREQELKILIERAEKDAFGSLIATASYRGEYLQSQSEQRMLAEVAARKNCAARPGAPAAPPRQPPGRRS